MKNKFKIALIITAAIGTGFLSHADDRSDIPVSYAEADLYLKFKPQTQTKNIRLDYDVFDTALNHTVFRMGISARKRMSRPAPRVGSRMVKGHVSPYRLEGSRVTFSLLNEKYFEGLTEYRKDLERIGSEIDLVRLNKKEQLAFWFNLHNVALIEQIAVNYPKRYPHLIEVVGQPLDEAKFLTVKGQSLSLKDIRENIVFPNWDNPDVIYGFFRGNIGSPAIQNFAYTGKNVDDVLTMQAHEFVNSLRGFNLRPNARNVSKLYEEAKPFYFRNWEADITNHLIQHARPEVAEEISRSRPIKIDNYDYVIADLLGGEGPSMATSYGIDSSGRALNGGRYPIEMERIMREVQDKIKILKRRGMITEGEVIIEDE